MSAEATAVLAEVAADDETLHAMPILVLNVHENCNCRCSMCDIWKRPAGKEVDLEKVRSYQDSIRKLQVRWIVLTGGEPLLHSRFADLCQLLKECDVKITVLSTGLLLKKRAAVLADFTDEIIVSLDGPREVHDRIRGIPRAFDLLQEGIEAVRKIRPDMPIQARSTIQSANFLALRRTAHAAREIGCDSISFLAVDTTSQAFNRELLWPVPRQEDVGMTAAQVQLLAQEMEALIQQDADLVEQGFIVERPDKLRRIVRFFRQRLGELPALSPNCNAPWVSAVVEVDGSVRPCFFHPAVGSTIDRPLHEAVNTQAARSFRQKLDIASNAICQQCVCSLNYRQAQSSH